jgi:hypothetical protein
LLMRPLGLLKLIEKPISAATRCGGASPAAGVRFQRMQG